MIGDVGFMGPPDDTGAVSLLCAFARPARGQGYATEALAALLRVGERPGGPDLRAGGHDAQQPVARRLLERVGFRPVGADGELRYYML